MPYSNVPESQWGKMDQCVKKVMAENPGYSKEKAIAICHSSVVGKKEIHMETTIDLVEKHYGPGPHRDEKVFGSKSVAEIIDKVISND